MDFQANGMDPPHPLRVYARHMVAHILNHYHTIMKLLFAPHQLSVHSKVEIARHLSDIKNEVLDKINQIIIKFENADYVLAYINELTDIAVNHIDDVNEVNKARIQLDAARQLFLTKVTAHALDAGVTVFNIHIPLTVFEDNVQNWFRDRDNTIDAPKFYFKINEKLYRDLPTKVWQHLTDTVTDDFIMYWHIILDIIKKSPNRSYLTEEEMAQRNNEIDKLSNTVENTLAEMINDLNGEELMTSMDFERFKNIANNLTRLNWKPLDKPLKRLLEVGKGLV